jgi:hypothetical protein
MTDSQSGSADHFIASFLKDEGFACYFDRVSLERVRKHYLKCISEADELHGEVFLQAVQRWIHDAYELFGQELLKENTEPVSLKELPENRRLFLHYHSEKETGLLGAFRYYHYLGIVERSDSGFYIKAEQMPDVVFRCLLKTL